MSKIGSVSNAYFSLVVPKGLVTVIFITQFENTSLNAKNSAGGNSNRKKQQKTMQ